MGVANMAAPMRKVGRAKNLQKIVRTMIWGNSEALKCKQLIVSAPARFQSTWGLKSGTSTRFTGLKALGAVAVGGLSFYLCNLGQRIFAACEDVEKPNHTPIRSIHSETDKTGLKLTLYQYQTCPFCCKVRAYLDYHGFSYDVVEVNSVWRKELKWTKYPKVPILVVDGHGPDGYLQINDSSVIISVLETLLEDPSSTIEKVNSYYPALISQEKRKTVYEFPNKYFIMYGEKKLSTSEESRTEERR